MCSKNYGGCDLVLRGAFYPGFQRSPTYLGKWMLDSISCRLLPCSIDNSFNFHQYSSSAILTAGLPLSRVVHLLCTMIERPCYCMALVLERTNLLCSSQYPIGSSAALSSVAIYSCEDLSVQRIFPMYPRTTCWQVCNDDNCDESIVHLPTERAQYPYVSMALRNVPWNGFKLPRTDMGGQDGIVYR